MGFFNKLRSNGQTFDGQGDERSGLIDNVFVNLEHGCLVHRVPYDNLSTRAKVTVQEGQQMVFMSEGMYSDLFQPGPHTLSTNNIPFLEKIVNLPYGGKSAFKTTLYVINTTRQRLAGDEGGWGVGLTIRDYTLSDEGVTIGVGAFGTYEFRITNAITFIREFVGTEHDTYLKDFTNQFSSALSQRVTSALSRYFSQQRTSITDVNNYLADIADSSRVSMNQYFSDYGIELTKFDIEAINPREDDPHYQQILQAQTSAGAMDLESRALARKRQREGTTYLQERQLDVMMKAAGNTGTAGAMMGTGMGIGMGVGVGSAIGSQMGTIAQGAMVNTQMPTGATPPPIGTTVPVQIYVYMNGAQAGPYDMPILQQLAQNGLLTAQTQVWKAGMPQWAPAATLPELAGLFAPVPPPMMP